MSATLVTLLIAVDLVLIGLVFIALRKKPQQAVDQLQMLRDIDREHRLLKELREAVREDLAQKHAEMKALYERVALIATEADMDLKSSAEIMSHELDGVLDEARGKLEVFLADVDKRRSSLSTLVRKAQEERQLLQKALQRGDKLTKFFSTHVPYEDVLEEIEDKKYIDARQLLAKGMQPQQVARELGLGEAEVQLIASMGA